MLTALLGGASYVNGCAADTFAWGSMLREGAPQSIRCLPARLLEVLTAPRAGHLHTEQQREPQLSHRQRAAADWKQRKACACSCRAHGRERVQDH